MKIQKLNWAGLKIECEKKTVLIDAVEDFKPYFNILGAPRTPLVRFADTTKADYMLFTHLHLDHFDVSVIDKCLQPGGKIIAHRMFEKKISKLNKPAIYLNLDESFEDEGIMFKAVFSLDGIGDEQNAWIVQYRDTKIFHGGDTIWHNQFWKLGRENPGINFAFLPINGVVANFEMFGLEYSSVPVSLSPEEAFNAAKLLHAQTLVPIHYGKFATPYYRPQEVSNCDFERLAGDLHQSYRNVHDGEVVI